MTTVSEDIQKINKLFPKGRLRRTNFILLEVLSLVLVMLCMGVVMDNRLNDNIIIGILVWVIILGVIILQIFIVSKRLQDCGYMALFSLLVFVPIINVAFAILLCIYPGEKDENKFGPDPRIKDIDQEKKPDIEIKT